jgi:hypothetical protein
VHRASPSAVSVGARRLPQRTSENASSETVWKIGISPEMGVPKALERAKEAAIGRFLPPQKCAREALGYFQTVSPRTRVN